MTPLVNVVLKGCRAMVLSFILLSIFGTSVSILGVHFDERTWMATKVHPNRKYFTRKNILVYLRNWSSTNWLEFVLVIFYACHFFVTNGIGFWTSATFEPTLDLKVWRTRVVLVEPGIVVSEAPIRSPKNYREN